MINVFQMLLSEDKTPYLTSKKVRSLDGTLGNCPGRICDILNNVFHADKLPEEHAWLVALNIQCKVIGIFEVSHGIDSKTYMTPKEVFTRALLSGAHTVILVHNHPSGNPTPGKEDRDVCKRMKEAGDLLNVPLVDFIVISDGCHYSFMEEGELK